MNFYKATIQYDGTNYFGFQWQKDIPSVQNDFNLALSQLLAGKVTTMSASRTDSGVHAVEQIVKITSEQPIEDAAFVLKLNENLPPQIRCLSLGPCASSYKPAIDNVSKEYRYLFTHDFQLRDVESRFIANNPYTVNVELMKRCAREIVGKHDFRNFCSTGSNVKSTVREIFECEISEINPHLVLPQTGLFPLSQDLDQCYQFRIQGKGFLKQMVRHLMSALWMVGAGKISPEEFSSLLSGAERPKRLWKVATPRGLYLYRVNF